MSALFGLLLATLRSRTGLLLIGLALAMLTWGQYGKMEWLRRFDPGWLGIGGTRTGRPGTVWLSLPWGQDLVGFAGGAVLLVAAPSLFVRLVLKRRLADFGLGCPRGEALRQACLQGLVLLVVLAPGFYHGASFDSIAKAYPYYWGDPASLDFAAFELATLLFYGALECFFRGFVLFAVYNWICDFLRANGVWDRPGAGAAAIAMSMLPYACWHLGKPPPEMWGTIAWGVIAGAAALSAGTVWHVVIVHWLLNVFMDYCIVLRHGPLGGP